MFLEEKPTIQVQLLISAGSPIGAIETSEEKDKTKYITFELEICTGTGAGAPTYKKNMRTFDEGMPQDWLDVLCNMPKTGRVEFFLV